MAGSGSQGKPVPGDKLSRKMHVSRVIASWFRPRAFISYSRQDADVAKRLYESVSSTGGCETFLDTEGTLTGEHFERVIVRQLRQADVVVAVIYILINLLLSSLSSYLERKLRTRGGRKVQVVTAGTETDLLARQEVMVVDVPGIDEINK